MTSSVVLNSPSSRSYNHVNSRFNEVSKLSKGITQDIVLNIDVAAVYPTTDLLEIIDEWNIKLYSTSYTMYLRNELRIFIAGSYFDCKIEEDDKLGLTYILVPFSSEHVYTSVLTSLTSKSTKSTTIYSISGSPFYNVNIVVVMEYASFVPTIEVLKPQSIISDKIDSYIDGSLLEVIDLINKIIAETGKALPDILKILKSVDSLKSDLNTSNASRKKLESKNDKLKKKVMKLQGDIKGKDPKDDKIKKKKNVFSLFTKKTDEDISPLSSPASAPAIMPSYSPPYITSSPHVSSPVSSLVF